ncbi:MAG: type II toxin-antitoxin system RelE/ParE family toxin [Fibrobacterota bacterium]
MNYSFHSLAEIEFTDAVDYYDRVRPGLGTDFAEEFSAVIERILIFPSVCSPIGHNTRRALVNRFPYGIIYHASESDIFILAVMQLNRRPGYWKRRIHIPRS